jgi:hypothetical protein
MSIPPFNELLTSHDPIRANFLIHLPLNDLLQLCTIDVSVNKLCQNDYIWRQRVYNDFPFEVQNFTSDTTWKNYYIYLYRTFRVKKYKNGVLIENFRETRPLLDHFKVDFNLGGPPRFYTDKNNRVIAFSTPINAYYPLSDSVSDIQTMHIFDTVSPEVRKMVDAYTSTLRAKGQTASINREGVPISFVIDDNYIRQFGEMLSDSLTNIIPK